MSEVVTSGRAAKIQLLADKKKILTDGQDVVHIEVNILDDKNLFVPDASNSITFKVEGPAEILAVDNGDPLSEESFTGNSRSAFNGKCLLIVKSTRQKGRITVYAESPGLTDARITFNR